MKQVQAQELFHAILCCAHRLDRLIRVVCNKLCCRCLCLLQLLIGKHNTIICHMLLQQIIFLQFLKRITLYRIGHGLTVTTRIR